MVGQSRAVTGAVGVCAVPQLPLKGAGVAWERGDQAGTLCGLAHVGCQSRAGDCIVASGWAVPVPPALADAMDKPLEVRGTEMTAVANNYWIQDDNSSTWTPPGQSQCETDVLLAGMNGL